MAYIKSPLQAVTYSKFRPSPSADLINTVVTFVSDKITGPLRIALDIGCGSGQSTEVLSPYFERVVGIDSSEEQLQHAPNTENKHSNVSYRLGSAEELEEESGSVDLVTVGQAVHWFDLERFSAEVGRVLRPNGVLAIYGYYLPRLVINGVCLSHVLKDFTLEQYVPEESKAIYFNGYTEEKFSKFSFSCQPATRLNFEASKKNLKITDLMGYLKSTSMYQNYMKEHGEEKSNLLLTDFQNQLAEGLPGGDNTKEMEVELIYPYVLLLIRKDK